MEERSQDEVEDKEKEQEPVECPEWMEEQDPTHVKVFFRGDDEWAMLRTMTAAAHIRLERVRKKLTNTEFSAAMVEVSVEEWTFLDGDGTPVPIPTDVPPAKRQADIWEHIPTRWFQRMSLAAATLMDPGDDRLGGLSYEVFRKEKKVSVQDD